MTGWIDVDLKLTSENLCPGDPTQLSFNFYSSAASFVSASLKFCYTDGNGVYHEQDIPIVTPPSGLQFMASQNFTLPTLPEVDLVEDQMDGADWKFKITLRNTTSSRTFERPFSLSSHMTRCSVTLPSVSDPDK